MSKEVRGKKTSYFKRSRGQLVLYALLGSGLGAGVLAWLFSVVLFVVGLIP